MPPISPYFLLTRRACSPRERIFVGAFDTTRYPTASFCKFCVAASDDRDDDEYDRNKTAVRDDRTGEKPDKVKRRKKLKTDRMYKVIVLLVGVRGRRLEMQ